MKKSKDIIYLRNKTQVVIYDKELRGQISDGMWENDRTDERLWYAQVKKATPKHPVGCNFTPKHPMNFDELDYVRDRAIEYAREIDPKYDEGKLSKDLQDITKIIFGENPVKNETVMIDCPDCGGSGLVEEDCFECSGTGMVEDPEDNELEIECPSCEGLGYEENDCWECSGTGEVEEE